MQLSDILILKFPKADFTRDILLQDDGQGAYIKEWNLEDPKPSLAELSQWAVELDLAHRQRLAVLERKYPLIGEQLDMLYHDMKDGTDKWLKAIDKVKADHPKPTE